MTRDVLELAGSLAFLDELYRQYQDQAPDLDPGWHALLGEPSGAPAGGNGRGYNGHGHGGNGASTAAAPRPMVPSHARPGAVTMSPIAAQAVPSVWPLVNAYRGRGHFAANLDPLGLLETARISELDPATWGFSERDLERVVEPTGVHGMPRATVGELLAHLQRVYATSVGLEFMHISSPARR